MNTQTTRAAPSFLSDAAWQVDLRVVVWSAQTGWRARVTGPGAIERDFVSPFELARFVGWPFPPTLDHPPGLR